MNRAQGQRPPAGVPALAAAHLLPPNAQLPPEAPPVSPPPDSTTAPAPSLEGAPAFPPSPIEEHPTGSVSPTANTNPPISSAAASKESEEEEEEAEDSMPPVPPVLAATGATRVPPELEQPVAERRNRPTSMHLAPRGGGMSFACVRHWNAFVLSAFQTLIIVYFCA